MRVCVSERDADRGRGRVREREGKSDTGEETVIFRDVLGRGGAWARGGYLCTSLLTKLCAHIYACMHKNGQDNKLNSLTSVATVAGGGLSYNYTQFSALAGAHYEHACQL